MELGEVGFQCPNGEREMVIWGRMGSLAGWGGEWDM